jgi:2-methylisocitrate lyase-like PEP mutase family enzyme
MLLGRIPSHQELVERFCERLRQGRLIIPGAVDPLAGLLAKRAGFSVLYLSGAALSASYGCPTWASSPSTRWPRARLASLRPRACPW